MSEVPKPGEKMTLVTTEGNPAAVLYGHVNPVWGEKGGKMQLSVGNKYYVITVKVEKVEAKVAE
jgi:hypothetical protein